MKLVYSQQFNVKAKCGMQQHGSWLAFDSLSYDRTPEGINPRRSLKEAVTHKV